MTITEGFMNKTALLLILSFLSACSVYKASDLQGASVEDITKCKDRSCFLGLGSQELQQRQNQDGTSSVVYKVKRKNGNAGRALMYGVADVFTLGLWEVVGTPLEGYVSDKDSIVYEVTYAPNGSVNKMQVQGN